MSVPLMKRLRSMDGAELKFRARAALRTRVRRAHSTLRPPGWRREALRIGLTSGLVTACDALARSDWHEAHRCLASHFARRPAIFPLDPRQLDTLAARIASQFPANDAVARAERILQGRYELLGHHDIAVSMPPEWHKDPLNGRTAPIAFWNAVPYLDPACGDHKVTWELNRHQHFLVLGRAYALSGDRRFYVEFVRQLMDWIRCNPPLVGTNWASMLELAFRCLSWTWALHFFARAASADDEEPWTVDLLMALDRQLAHVEENLSRYFSPNTHLTGEALALYVTGRALPELSASARRAATGREILLQEAGRQVLEDGGHAERSTHYHRYSTDFYLFAFNTARASADRHGIEFREPAVRQARFLRAIADDTGRIPLIGDDDGGQLFPVARRPPADCADTLATAAVLLNDPSLAVGAPPEETFWLCGSNADLEAFTASRTGPRSIAFEAAGYCISRNTRGDHLVFDCGAHGYLNGGHAHADALSVVLTVAGRPLLIDPGTATYTMDPGARERFRSSAMHNTVTIDGRSQSLPLGPFHWRTRADARCVRWESTADRDVAAGRHDGYAPVLHTREVTSVHGTGWTIVDRIEGDGRISAASMWHFHPDWSLEHIEDNRAFLRHLNGAHLVFLASAALHVARDAMLHEWAPVYGRIERALCLESIVTAAAPFTMAAFVPADGRLETALTLASSVHLAEPD
jgi:hypothetical protein